MNFGSCIGNKFLVGARTRSLLCWDIFFYRISVEESCREKRESEMNPFFGDWAISYFQRVIGRRKKKYRFETCP